MPDYSIDVEFGGKSYSIDWQGNAPPSEAQVRQIMRGLPGIEGVVEASEMGQRVGSAKGSGSKSLNMDALKAVAAAAKMGGKAGGVRSGLTQKTPEKVTSPVKQIPPRAAAQGKSLADYAKAAESGKGSAFVDQQPRGPDGAKQIKARAKKQFDSVMTPEMVRRALLLSEIEKRAAERSSVGFGETEGAYKAGNTQEQQLATMIEAERKARAQKTLDPLRGPAMALQGMSRIPGDLLSPVASSVNPEMQRAILADAVKQAMAQGMDPQQASQVAQQKATEFARFQGQTLMNALQTVGAFAPHLAPFASSLNTAVLNPSLTASVAGAGVDPRLTLQQKLGQFATVAGPIAGMKALPMMMRGIQAGARGVRGLVENFQPTDAIKRASGYEPEFIQRYSASGKDKGASKIYNYDPAGAPFGFVPPEPAPVNTPALPGPVAKAPKAKAAPTPKPSAPEPVSPVEQAYKEAVGEVDTPVRASTETTPGTPPGASTVQTNEGPVTRAGAKTVPAPGGIVHPKGEDADAPPAPSKGANSGEYPGDRNYQSPRGKKANATPAEKPQQPVQVPTQPQPLGKAPWQAVKTKNPLTGKQEGFDTEDQLREYESIKEGHRRTMKGLEARQQEGDDVTKDVRTAEDKLRRDLTQFWTRKKQAAGQASGIEPDLDRAFAEAVGDEPKPAAKPVKTPMPEIRTVADGSKNRPEGNGLRSALGELERVTKRFKDAETSLRTRQATLATAKPKDRKAIQDEIDGLQETVTQLTLIGKQKRKAVEVEYATLARDYPDVIEAARTTPTVLSPTTEVQQPAKAAPGQVRLDNPNRNPDGTWASSGGDQTGAPGGDEATRPGDNQEVNDGDRDESIRSHGEWLATNAHELQVGDWVMGPNKYGRSKSIAGRVDEIGERFVSVSNASSTWSYQHENGVFADGVTRKHLHSVDTTPERLEDLNPQEMRLPLGGNDLERQEGHTFTQATPSKERWFFRYGAPPESGFSKNSSTGEMEEGVSCYVTPTPTSIMDTGRPLYAIRGRAIGTGSDDEPVIQMNGAKVVKVPQKLIDRWNAASDLLDPMNKVMRAEFEKRSGTKLPKTISGTDQAVKDYFGQGTQASPMQEGNGGANPGAPEKPTQLADEPTQLAEQPTQLEPVQKVEPNKQTTATISEEPSNERGIGPQNVQEPVPGDRETGTRDVGPSSPRPLEEVSPEVARVPDEARVPDGSSGDSRTPREKPVRVDGRAGDGPVRSERDSDEGKHPSGRGGRADGDAPVANEESPAPEVSTAQNYVIEDAAAHHVGGLKTKFYDNVAAIETLRRITVEGRHATPKEQAILAKFVGWGAMPGAFNRYDADAGAWTAERDIITKLLSPEEFDAGAKSTLNAHYTAGPIVQGMWDMALRMGVTDGTGNWKLHVLEPSMGSGNFFGLMPAPLRNAKATGIELDTLTGRIAQALYPNFNVLVRGFETVRAPDGFFDVAIGNVPFGDYKISDKRYNIVRDARIHDYFFLKSLDLVRPGGVVMFITSTGTLDKRSPAVRETIAAKANLVAAFRLPDGAFKANAGTEVVTDLIILQRRADGEESSGPDWMAIGTMPDPDGGQPIPINEYYVAHPQNILGKLDRKGTMYRADVPHVSVTPDFEERWKRAIESVPSDIYTERASAPRERTLASGKTKVGAYVNQDGKLLRNLNGELIPVDLPARQVEIIKASMKVASTLRDLVDSQVTGAPQTQVDKDRDALNTIYDAFVKRFGYLNAKENATAFADDPDSPVLLSLEHWDAKSKKAKKSDIFSKNTIRHTERPANAGTIGEAVGISLNESGSVDVGRIAGLLGKPESKVASELIASGLAFQNPATGYWEGSSQYLSGNVRAKLVDATAAAEIDKKYEPNVRVLEKVQPQDIPYEDLDARLGVPWIPPSDIEDFAASLFWNDAVTVKYITRTGEWLVDYKSLGSANTKARMVYGTERAPFADILVAALNNRPITIRDKIDEKTSVINPEETAAANLKVEEIHGLFQDWVWDSPARRERLHRHYNDNFNNVVPTKYDGSHLTFPGQSPEITLRQHQADAVWRTIVKGTALYAHEVGTGKTYTIVSAAMELRRMKLARKPAIAVLNATLPGFAREARELYPNARILVVENFDSKSRKRTVSQIATGDWDMVILTHDNLDMLPMSTDTQADFIRAEMRELEAVIAEATEEGGGRGKSKSGNRVVKKIENAKAKLEKALQDALDGRKDDAVIFEETGIDFIFVDEAHKYKSLPVHTKQDRVKGIPQGRSDRATQMWMRTRWLQRMNQGRGVVFATGTPVTNTMAELFTMQRYLQGADLSGRSVDAFDAWAKTFGVISSKIETTVTGDMKSVSRFSRFINLPELAAISSEVIDVKRAAEMKDIKRPRKVEKVVPIEITDTQVQLMRSLQKRAEEVKKKKPGEGGDNMLAITTDGRKAALDMRLVHPDATEGDSNKVSAAIRIVIGIWKAEPTSTQMIFCDMGINPTPWGFSVYGEIIEKLVRAGVPRDKIINFAALTDVQKRTASLDLKEGRKLIAIGSTEKMGTGVNAQDHLHYIHHLDVPWMPGLLEQRDGRGWRQGNRHPEINIFRYVTEGKSMDAFMWQLIDSKSRFISQFIDGMAKNDPLPRSIVDEDSEELTPAQITAIALGDPMFMEKVNLESEIEGLRRASRRHEKSKVELTKAISDLGYQLERETARLAAAQDMLQTISKQPEFKGENVKVTIHGKVYTDRDIAQEAIDAGETSLTWEPRVIGEIRGMPISARRDRDRFIYEIGGENREGRIYTFEHAVRDATVKSRISGIEGTIAKLNDSLKSAQEQSTKAFPKADELAQKATRLTEIERIMVKDSEGGGASKQAGALFPKMRKLPKGHVPKGDYPLATRVGLSIYRSGKTSLKDFRAAAIEKIGGWIEKESGLLWKTVRQLDIEEPAHLGEHLKTATRPKRDKTMLDWLSEAFFTTGHRAAQARGHLETAWGMKKGSLVGSSEDIEAAINRMTRLGGKIESTVLRGFMDADGNRITKGLPEIQSALKKAKVDTEDFQVFMRAMRENSISRRPGNVAIGPERVMANEVAIESFREKYKGREAIISQAAQDFMNFADEHLRMFETYGLRPEGWADGIREMNPIYWPLFEAQSPEDLAMQDVAPGARGSGEIDLKQVKGGKRYADGWATMAQQVERVIRAGEMSKAFTPFLEEASKHPLMQWIAKDITEEVETKRMLEKQRRLGIVTEQEMNALDGDLQAQKDLDEMMAQMLKDVDLNNDAIIVTYKDGEKRYWKMDPYLWAATKGAAPEQFNGVMQILRYAAGLNRGLTTKYNPLFAFVFNPMIDVVSATAQHGMNPAQFFKGLYHAARGEKSALYRKALQNEVFFNSRGMRDFLEQQWVFEGGEKAGAIRALADKLLATKVVEFVSRASQTMEEATRLGMFAQMEKAYRKRGLPADEATRRASDDSANLMNFGEAGGMGRSFSRWGVPFANVTSQVIMSAYRGYRRNPMKFLLRLVALITIPKLIEYFLYKDDDEYKRMPNYAKDGTLMFKRGPGDWLAIRIPQELGMVFGGIPRRALEAKAGTKTAGEAAGDQASELAQMLMPRALPTLGASALQGLTYAYNGRTYDLRFGIREQYGDNKGYEQARQQAATLLGSLGKMGAEYTGYFMGYEEKPPAPMQRFAPRPGRPQVSVEGRARAEWLDLRNPRSNPRKKKGETDAQFAKRISAESAKLRRIIEAKMKESGWNKKSDDEKRKALAKAGVAGMKTD